MAASTSVLARRRLLGRVGAVLARPRDGEGRRERLRAGVFGPDVRVRFNRPGARMTDSMLALGSSFQEGRIGVAVVPTVEPENLLSWAPMLCTLCTLDRLEPEPTGFLGMLCDEGLEKCGPVAASSPRTRAGAGMLSGEGLAVQASPPSKSGSGDSRPLPS
jgi:hypothetical protein